MTQSRLPDQLRPTTIQLYPTAAAGSVIIQQGRTRVLCTASIETELPKWLQVDPKKNPDIKPKGWVTAEYNMLPGSTIQRKKRGADSRATEIQRLIGRCLRAGVDLEKMPGLAITCDCDVLVADGGTRTASITGAYVALVQAIAQARKSGMIAEDPLLAPLAAVSVGVVDGAARLDLDYELDVRAQVDMNIAMNNRGEFIEVQGSAEHGTFSGDQLTQMLALASGGIRELIEIQKAVLA